MTDETWSARRTSFGSAADAYAIGRPTYPLEAIEWVLPPGSRTVLDLAAGTGRLTERLLEVGLDVIAVEPLAEMRAHVPSAAQVLDGTAEQIPLDDASVDAIVVGQAFHWFDVPQAMPEIARVLRVGGRLGLMWNLLDDSDAWVEEFFAIVGGDEKASAIDRGADPPYPPTDLMGRATRREFRHRMHYDADRLTAYIASRSQTILLPDDERAGLLARVAAHVPEGGVTVPLVCEVWRGDRLAA